ncbi:uncharacterized protein LY89DRAFT_722631 [Mollisia scopiformis]|uniref:PEBP-like protein n=1 Tax=Mollisia scopiformis TaxID=149040 RepID=A0A194WUZ5_MOLSC|nr:uncharacterized protein LY89DRAFT_722631 [Mollisia scopiformis]KUJ11484.1 hypothetical protein LY89DRAFT_722631 [Mollisia scopiformis]
MLSSTILAVALAGAAIAFTPSGFQPSSTQNMTVVFGNTLAVNGKEMQKADVAKAPTLGTAQRMFGTYTVMMVDPDIPPATAGGATSELLHWMQAGLVSSNTSTTVAGVTTFELINPMNVTAFATYIQPSPPDKAPNTHRYTQLLLNTTGNTSALTTLARFAMTRTNFSAVNVVNSAGVKIIAGNSFDVSNGTLVQSNITKTTSVAGSGASATGTGTGTRSSATSSSNGTVSSTGTPKSTGGASELTTGGALIAGLGALAAALIML